MSEGDAAVQPPCPRCNGPLVARTMRTAVWQGDRLAVVEDVPSQYCPACMEQFYDDDVTDALRVLNEKGFPEADARKMIAVPVFTLEGRIRKRGPPPEDTVDY